MIIQPHTHTHTGKALNSTMIWHCHVSTPKPLTLKYLIPYSIRPARCSNTHTYIHEREREREREELTPDQKLEEGRNLERCNGGKRWGPKCRKPSKQHKGCEGLKPSRSWTCSTVSSLRRRHDPIAAPPNSPFSFLLPPPKIKIKIKTTSFLDFFSSLFQETKYPRPRRFQPLEEGLVASGDVIKSWWKE